MEGSEQYEGRGPQPWPCPGPSLGTGMASGSCGNKVLWRVLMALSRVPAPGAGCWRISGLGPCSLQQPWGSQHPGAEQGGLGLWRWSPCRPPLRRAGTPQLTGWGQHDPPVPGHPGDPAKTRTATGTVPGSRLHTQGQNGARGHGVVNTDWAALQHSIQTSHLPHSPLLGCFRWTRLWARDVYVSLPAWLWHHLRALGRQDSFMRTAAPCPHAHATSWPSWA